MRNYLTLLFLFFNFLCFSQNIEENFKEALLKTKAQSIIDSQDKAALNLINEFYEDVLQSDKGELQTKTIEKLKSFLTNKNSKNIHLAQLFLMYQKHVEQTAGTGLKSNAELQLLLINALEEEFETIYNLTPAIVYIYKSEALNTNNKTDEANQVVKTGLVKYPDAVPLKVYAYLDSKDETIKEDLVKNHSNHWFVLLRKIK